MYGSAGGLSLGAGLVFDDVLHPQYDDETKTYDTAKGAVYVLTHECDADPSNDRFFNEMLAVCPVIPLADFVAEAEKDLSEAELVNLLVAIAKNKVSRVYYLPPLGVEGPLELGGLMYLNSVCSTPVSEIRSSPICALSAPGLQRMDWKPQNHFFRPKAESLSNL
jgi:hypothetical protein